MATTYREPLQKKPRKQRQPKACHLCRQRKVKCNGVPCSSCALRGEAQLCSMEPRPISVSWPQSLDPSTNSSPIAAGGGNTSRDTMVDGRIRAECEQAHPVPEQQNTPYSAEARQSSLAILLPPILAAPHQPLSQEASIVYDPDNVAADGLFDLRERLQQPHQRLDNIWSQHVSEMLNDGLNFVVSFGDLSLPRKSIVDLCLALPSNDQMQRQAIQSSLCKFHLLRESNLHGPFTLVTMLIFMVARYYQIYSDVLLPIYPGLGNNRDRFEAELQSLLDDRDRIITSAGNTSQAQHKYDASWFALLFSVLACGAQCLSTMDEEAELNSKVFGSISFSCLLKGNFLVSPTINSIQALLHIGSILRNDMNPGVAWSLLGLTIRLAQVVGCHEQQLSQDGDALEDVAITKINIWWSIVWHDMILALCYGHPSGTLSVKTQVPPVLDPNGHVTFADVIHRVCSVCLSFLRHRLWTEEFDQPQSHEYAYQLVQKIEDILLKAQPHLRSTASCLTMQQHVEYFAVAIYRNHAAAQILKLTLQDSLAEDHTDEHQISDLLVEKSVAIVEAYLRLRQLSTLSSHYWSLLQASVSAAKFLLTRTSAIERSRMNPLVEALIASLKSSCDEGICVRNSFSTSLSQIVGDLVILLRN